MIDGSLGRYEFVDSVVEEDGQLSFDLSCFLVQGVGGGGEEGGGSKWGRGWME